MKPKYNETVAFAGSAFWECRTHAMKHGKIHIGKVETNGIRSTCQSHQYGRRISTGNYKIIESVSDEGRLCKFCRDSFPSLMNRLLTTPPKPDMFYLLIHPTKGEPGSGSDFVIAKNTDGSIRRRLLNNPEFLRELKNNLKQTGNVKLMKAHFIEVDFKIREVVESITFKE
jgi:hypothetical protein